jgi:hypothetical protein
MKKLAIAFAGLAALGFSGAAFAEDGGWNTTTGPAAMSDTEMDSVTAAGLGEPGAGIGNFAAGCGQNGNPNCPQLSSPPSGKGEGWGTAGANPGTRNGQPFN